MRLSNFAILIIFFSSACGGDDAVPGAVVVADNTLYFDAEGDRSNGRGEYFFAGQTMFGSRRRAVIRFDVTAPADSVLISARLVLNMSRSANTTERDINLHRLTADWGEGASDAPEEEGAGTDSESGDATWIHRSYPDVLWQSPGGDFDAQASATSPVGAVGVYEWSSPDLLADVQYWIETPSDNHGWILIGDESTDITAKRFDSRVGPIPPDLVLEFSVPDEM